MFWWGLLMSALRCNPVEMVGPALQCAGHRRLIFRMIVNASHATFMSAAMVENGLADPRFDSEFAYLRCAGSSKIVQAPRGDA